MNANDILLFVLDKLVVGIITGLVASMIFFYALYTLKPKLKISDQIAKGQDVVDGRTLYRIKVVNHTKVPVIDVRAQLHIFRGFGAGQGRIYKSREVELKQSSPIAIPQYNKKDKEANYAYRFVTYKPLDEEWRDAQEFLRFRIICNHAVSGFGQYFFRDYYVKDDIVEGNFEKGDSFKIR